MTFSGGAAPDPDRDSDRRQQLIATARLLADETGSAAFTVAQLTSRAGVSLKAFYTCFRGKDDLLLALLAADSRIGADVLNELIGNRTGREGLRAYVAELFGMLALQGAIGYAGVLVRERRRLIESHDAELRDALAPLVDLLARNIDSDDPKRDASTMFAVLLEGINDIVVGRVADVSELADYLYSFCTTGAGGA